MSAGKIFLIEVSFHQLSLLIVISSSVKASIIERQIFSTTSGDKWALAASCHRLARTCDTLSAT
ncbi:hypothetical protein [Streptococcus orisratti]